MIKNKVLCIGEALIDRIICKSNNEYKDYFGGAPANVACALKKLNVSSAFIGCLGNDKDGKEFVDLFNALDVDISFLQVNNKFSTRIVNVLSDDYGDRSFSGFETKNNDFFADEALDKSIFEKKIYQLEKLYSETKYIITGTNLLSSSKSSQALNFLLNFSKDYQIKIVIDLNWRDIFWQNSSFTKNMTQLDHINKIKKFLTQGSILKLAHEEAILFFGTNDPCLISNNLPKKPDVIITHGSNPIIWFIQGIQGSNSLEHTMKIIDTTGAGDAFLAGLISQLVNSEDNFNKTTIKNLVHFANVSGLLTCLGKGAIESQPYYSKVLKFLDIWGS